MSQRIVIAQQGDTLDLIVFRNLGSTAGSLVEKTLALNPGLCEQGIFLPTGTTVRLPDAPTIAPAVTIKETLQLWD